MSQSITSPTIFGGGPILAALERKSSKKPSPQRKRSGSGLAQALERQKHTSQQQPSHTLYSSASNSGKSLFKPSLASSPGQCDESPLHVFQLNNTTHSIAPQSATPELSLQNIKHMPLSEATAQLRSLRRSSWLDKKGFHWFKRWAKRYVVLHGRLLKYYESIDGINEHQEKTMPRGSIELTAHFLIMTSTVDDRAYGFKIVPVATPLHKESPLPNMLYAELVDDVTTFDQADATLYGGKQVSSAPKAQADGDIWYFSCTSELERDSWIQTLRQSIGLIKRCDDTRPTLSGMGDVHDHYIIGNVLGVGRFGVVREGANKHTKKLCAIKIINKKKHLKTETAEKIVRNEIKLMRVIARVANVRHHPHLVSLHEHYEDDFLIYIVMDSLKGGDLLDHLVDGGACGATGGAGSGVHSYTEYHIMLITQQILKAVHALHDVGVIHRDIKPENILYEDLFEDAWQEQKGKEQTHFSGLNHSATNKHATTTNMQTEGNGNGIPPSRFEPCSIQYPTDVLKIADFSLAGTMRQFHKEHLETGVKVVVGTPGYIAPESLVDATYTTASDMYAVGVCVYTMLVGYPPVSGSSKEEVFRKTRNGDWGFNKIDWLPLTQQSKKFVWDLLSVDPSKRPSALNALQHKWFLPTASPATCNAPTTANTTHTTHTSNATNATNTTHHNGQNNVLSVAKYHLPLTRSKSRLECFNSQRNLKIAAFNALVSSRNSAAGLNSTTPRRNNRRGSSLKAQVRGMKPSPSCPDLKSLRASASTDNIKGLASGRMPNDAYKLLSDRGTGGGALENDNATGIGGTGTGGGGKSSSSSSSSSTMSRSHSVGGSLASIGRATAANESSPTHHTRVAQMRGPMMDTISESNESGGSYSTSVGDSLPRFTPGSLSTFSKNEMARIHNRGGSGGGGGTGPPQQPHNNGCAVSTEGEDQVSQMLGSSYQSSSHESPLGF